MTDSAIKALANHLALNISGLNTIAGWPDPKDDMIMPCASIILAGENNYMNLMPTVVNSEADPDSDINKLFTFMVGQYDFELQIDLWCKHKIERTKMLMAIEEVFNSDFVDSGSGVELVLSDQYNAIASYCYIGYSNEDNESNIQQGYWRSRISVLVNYPKLIRKSLPSIKENIIYEEIETGE